MNTRERFNAVVDFRPFDRLPVIEWAMWWDKTIERWHSEGLPCDITDRYDLYRHFGQDIYWQDWLSPRKPGCPSPAAHGAGLFTPDMDYDRLKQHLFPDRPLNTELWTGWAKKQAEGEVVMWFTVEGFFWFPRTLFGIEQHLYAFYDNPELIHRINRDFTDWILRVIDQIAEICVPDFMTFAEDMSYNHGPMLSRDLFDEFMKPYYLEVIPRLDQLGIVPIVDSDGDITVATEWFANAGVKGMLPLERQAGIDMTEMRRRYPDMNFIGHFDKMVMHKGEAALRGEFERLLPVAATGGFLVSCDHQTPPGVSYEDYRLYISLFKEYAAEAGRLSRQKVASQ